MSSTREKCRIDPFAGPEGFNLKSSEAAKRKEHPQRFFGPVDGDLAEKLTEMALDDERFREDLIEWATGQIDQQELIYRIQRLYEVNEQRRNEPEPLEGTEFDEPAFGDSGVA